MPKCIRCSNILPDDYNYKSCPSCREKYKINAREKRQSLKKNQACISCGVSLPEGYSHSYCDECRKIVNERVLKLRNTRVKNHVCETCGVILPKGYKNRKCPECKKKYNEYCAERVFEDVDNGPTITYTEEHIKSLLIDLFKDQPIVNLQKKDYNLYHIVYRNAKQKGLKVSQYLKELGFVTNK